MMGRSSRDQGQLFYSFNLEEVVPDDHLVRAISEVLDLSWVRGGRVMMGQSSRDQGQLF